MISFIDLASWALCHVGALYLVTESGIGSPVRRLFTRGFKANSIFVSLLYCAGCCGFWLGLLEGVLGLTVYPAFESSRLIELEATRVVLTGFAGMGLGAWWGAQRPGISRMYELEQFSPGLTQAELAELEKAVGHDHASTQEEGREPEREPEAPGSKAPPGVAGDDANDPDRADRDARDER